MGIEEQLLGEDAPARAAEAIGPLWAAELAKAAGPSAARLGGLLGLLGERWLGALREQVGRDVMVLRNLRPDAVAVERWIEATVALVPDLVAPLHGRVDRLVRAGDGVWIDDWKTGGKIEKKVDPRRMLQGLGLQLFLYREIVAASLGVEPSAVQARILGLGPDVEGDVEILEAEGALREGVLETAAIALRLALEGRFPLFPDSEKNRYCRWCGYARSCRKNHEPTRARIEVDPHLADLRDAREKSTRSGMTIADVRARRGEGEAAGLDDEGGDE
jgi:hypothetical protein